MCSLTVEHIFEKDGNKSVTVRETQRVPTDPQDLSGDKCVEDVD